MDGFKRILNNSLQFRLSLCLSLIIATVTICGGIISFKAAFDEANEFQDDHLRQIAGLMQEHPLPPDFSIAQSREQIADPDSQVLVHVISRKNSTVPFGSHEILELSAGLPEGIQTFQAKLDQWRLFIRTLPTGDRLVVGQRTDDRDELARNAGLRTVFPLIFLIPVLLILINVLIRHMLRPITRLATELDQRHDTDLQSLDERGVPDEIKPFIASINRLLLRVDKSMEIQRRFVADAAHELRSPLTALTLQAENLAKIALPPAADERLTALRSGLHRMHSLLEQLLTMARSQTPLPVPVTAIPVADMFRRVLENMMPMAEQKNLNIEVEADPDALFRGHEFDGMTLIKNLIDNAIRYTPSGGKITLRAQQQGTTLSVEIEDTGPGIPAAEQDRIFDPFYRIPGSGEVGSGLGLAIIKTILKRMGATISLLNLVNPSSEIEGFRFTVLFHHQ